MKWPAQVMLIRHDTSVYNALRDKKKESPLYQRFLEAFKENPDCAKTRALARQVQKKFALACGDADTPLLDAEGRQSYETGCSLARAMYPTPDIIFVSPYLRALETLKHIKRGWMALEGVKVVEEERVREQEHGLALLYNDWRVFHTLHPDQRLMHERQGPYWYRYPQGENVSDVRERNRSWLTTLTRDFSEKRVLVVTHHLNILAMRANLERWSAEQFIHFDENEKPINCGVTIYEGNPDKGTDGKLELREYNSKLYQ